MEMEIILMAYLMKSLLFIIFTLFCFSDTPLVLCLFLILISFTVSMSQMIVVSKWIAASTILIFLGGMMVVFFYATSLSNNDKIKININNLIMISFMLITYSMLTFTDQNKFMNINYNYVSHTQNFIIFMLFYILISLLCVIKMASSFKGTFMKSFF